MDKQRQEDYLSLINKLLICPSGQESEILQTNVDLIDEGLVVTINHMIILLEEYADKNDDSLKFLTQLVSQIATKIKSSQNMRNRTLSESKALSKKSKYFFLLKALKATAETNGEAKVVYPIFRNNLDKLDDDLINIFENLAQEIFDGEDVELIKGMAVDINNFANLIVSFPEGSQAINLEIALTGYEIVSKIFMQQGDPQIWSSLQTNMGNVYRIRIRGDKVKNLEKAIEKHKIALNVCSREKFPKLWSTIQNNLGNTYIDHIHEDPSTNIERAIQCYESALQVRTYEEFPQDWAQTQNNLGNAYRNRIYDNEAQNLEKAIQCCEFALQVRTYEEFPQDWAQTQNNLGNAYCLRIIGSSTDNLRTAIHCYEAALQVRIRENFPQDWAMTQNNLGNAYRDRGLIDKAIMYYQAALDFYTPIAFPVSCFKTGRNLGKTAFAANLWIKAIEGYDLAINSIEQLRNWSLTDARRQEILSDASTVYTSIVQAYINNNQPDKALEYVERSKARNLVELLTNRDIYPKGNISEIVFNALKRLRREVVSEQRRLDIVEQNHSGGLISGNDEPMLGSAAWLKNRDHLNELLQQLDNLITAEIDIIDPNFRATQQVKPISYTEIQNLVDERTAMVEWYITDNNFYTFIIIHQSQHPQVWSSSAEEQQAFLDWQEEYLKNYQQNRDQWIDKLSDHLSRLSEILHIDDIINSLPSNCDRIILIPHRFLHLIPLHALPLSEGGFLVDRFPKGVRYAPSCQLLQLTQNQERRNFDRFLAIQNPTKDLGYATVEVGTIQHYFPHADVFVEHTATKATPIEVKIKDDGTREVIQNSQLSLANCAHFSCHSEFNFESPLNSALLLANGECLTLGEIFDLDLSQCRLVTLSACETGLTNYKILSDEYVGIPSSFLYAGSPSVVSSLWTVQDVSTSFLMINFYQNLQINPSVAVALNQAQIWLRYITKAELKAWIIANSLPLDPTIRQNLNRRLHKLLDDQKPFQEPFYWAAFCAIGQ
jgi:CHAT domain-containing protein